MRNAMPLRWIEQAEARRVVENVLMETRATAPRCAEARRAAGGWLARLTGWLARLTGWFAPENLAGWMVLQTQPALAPVRSTRTYRRVGEDGYRCDW